MGGVDYPGGGVMKKLNKGEWIDLGVLGLWCVVIIISAFALVVLTTRLVS